MATSKRKRAICIGLNYPGTEGELSGCANDALDWSELLGRRGYDVTTIVDAEGTRARILSELADLVGKSKPKDSLVVTFSGHGTYVADEDGDEIDAHDEAICPADVFSAGAVVTDDELYEIFNDRDPKTKLVFISDSCHSGTVSRFAPLGARLTDPPAAIRKTLEVMGACDYVPKSLMPRVRFLPPAMIRKLPKSKRPRESGISAPPSSAMTSALLLAGCRDDQYSYDAHFAGRANGAFTRAAIDAYNEMPRAGKTYLALHRAIRKRLPSESYPQSPQIFGTYNQRRWVAL